MSFPRSETFSLCVKQSIRPLRMILVQPGAFWMGSPIDEQGRHHDIEGRFVCNMTEAYWLQDTPVTIQQFRQICGTADVADGAMMADGGTPNNNGCDRPITSVGYQDAVKFCSRLCELYLDSKSELRRFSLPTEAQWERACRAGTTTAYFHGSDARGLEHFAWYAANSDGASHPVGRKQPNPWGFYDMIGNVAEWCRDSFSFYPSVATDNWQGRGDAWLGVIRGGSCRTPTESGDLRCAARCEYSKSDRNFDIGFRVAFSAL